MHLTAKDFQKIAQEMNLAERSIQRILSSVIVDVAAGITTPLSEEEIVKMTESSNAARLPDASRNSSSERYDIGLRFRRDNESSPMQGKLNSAQVVAALKEYRSSCPIIFEWMQRGDFDAKKIPTSATRGLIMHASRTAGRLRAKILRTTAI